MKAGWEVKALGDVVSLEYGKPLPKEERHPTGEIAVYGANGIKDFTNKPYAVGPSIVVGRKGSAGELKYVEDDFWPLDVTYFTKHNANVVNLKFLMLLLEMQNLPSMARGVKPGINRNDVYALPIPLPPLDEQKRIVAVLDAAFEGLTRARTHVETNLQNARELFESYRDFHLTGSSYAPLGNYLVDITYGFTNPMPNSAEGPFKVTAKNVVDGKIDFNGTRRTTQDAFDELLTEKSKPQIGDVLLTKDGTLGRTAVVDRAGICVNQSVAVLRPNSEVLPDYLHEILSCRINQEAMIADAGGATIKHLYITRVPKIPVFVPEMQEQLRLLSELRRFQAVALQCVDHYRTKLQDLDDLRQSLLQKAFAGELT